LRHLLGITKLDKEKNHRGRDGGTNYILRIKEQETCLNLHEHDDDDINWKNHISQILLKLSGTLFVDRSTYTYNNSTKRLFQKHTPTIPSTYLR